MSQRTKAATIALIIICSLSAIKFSLYFISGSIAVLSEAWHSLADVATTVLVLLSIVVQGRKQARLPTISSAEKAEKTDTSSQIAATPSGSTEQGDTRKMAADASRSTLLRSFLRSFTSNSELLIALFIGLLLLGASLTIFYQALISPPATITAPLTTGLLFIALSFGSFFLYRFEENIARVEGSAALAADSMHNQADMAISLVAGISLLLYHFGINFDRWVAMAISFYLLMLALELSVNSLNAILRKNEQMTMEYRFVTIVTRIFQPTSYTTIWRYSHQRLQPGQKVNRLLFFFARLFAGIIRWGVRLAVVALLLLYGSTAFYRVAPDEKALILRFGKIARNGTALQPGLHLKLPWPLEKGISFSTGRVQSLTVGNSSGGETVRIWSIDHGDTNTSISGDNNLFLPYVTVHYRIQDVHAYYLNLRGAIPENLLGAVTTRLLNRQFASAPFYDLALYKRREWTEACRRELQAENDRLGSGLEIVDLCVIDIHPPIELAGAYEEVVAAEQLRQRYLNDAGRQVNALLSREQIAAMQKKSEAASYVYEKRQRAKGEARNYLLRYAGYKEGGSTMRELLLLQAAEKALAGKKILLVDPASGVQGRMLYIENYISGKKSR